MIEFSLGRSQRKGAIGAFESVFKNKRLGACIGTIPILGVTGVLIFYSVVVGWVLKYFIMSLMGSFGRIDVPAYFGSFVGTSQTIPWMLLGLLITSGIVILGVQKGIEKANKIMVPVLLVLMLILVIRSLTLPGALDGVKFLLLPNWSKLSEPVTWLMALGQAFFSVSLTGAGMVVYGSYLRKDVDIPRAAFHTAGYDTIAALLAAFIIIPAAFAFQMDPAAGPGLLFITIPSLFQVMPGGYIFGAIFFLCMCLTVLTSSVCIMEVPVEAMMDRLGWGRKKVVSVVAIATFILGLLLATKMNLFGMWVDVVTVYLVPFGTVLAAIALTWIYGVSKAREEVNAGAKIQLGQWWEPMAKYIFVGITILILIVGIIYGGL